MSFRRIGLLLVLIATVFAGAVPASIADVAPNPVSGGISLSSPGASKTPVIMQEETVSMLVSPLTCQTHAWFKLHNPGKVMTMEVGFPYSHPGELRNFKALVDGQEITPRERTVKEKVPDVPGKTTDTLWQTWDMSFPSNQTHSVDVYYECSTEEENPEIILFNDRSPWYQGTEEVEVNNKLQRITSSYILVTGSYWAGPIGLCKVEMKLDGLTRDHILKATPAPTSITDQKIVWEMQKFEPQSNITVSFLPNLKVSELQPYLESLLTRHPDDPNLAGQIGNRYKEHGDIKSQLALYDRFLRTWHEPYNFFESAQVGGNKMRSGAVLGMAETLIEEYDKLKLTDSAKAVAPVLIPMFKEYLRQIDSDKRDWGAKPFQKSSVQKYLELCHKYES